MDISKVREARRMAKNEAAEKRIEKLRSLMKEAGVDGILLRKRRSFSWLTGGRTNYIVQTTDLGVADLLIFPDKVFCVTLKMEEARIRDEELFDLDCEWVAPEWYEGADGAIAELCRGKTIGLDVLPTVPGVNGVDLGRKIAELAYVLDEAEMVRFRTLSQAAAKALEKTCREIQPGMTEHEIQAQLAYNVMKHGMNPQVILVATDERIYRYRHPIPTAKRLDKYAMLVLCAEQWGLVASCTRFVHFGPLSAELRENKEKLARIDLAMNLATRPGVPINEVFKRGIEMYERLGHADDWRYLHQGGPAGYAPREFLATPSCEGVVRLGQAFAWNPAIRGIKSEDTILVGQEENEFLTHTGEWPYIELEYEGRVYLRPDILVR
jgi:Xaa-Pro dipeptidase